MSTQEGALITYSSLLNRQVTNEAASERLGRVTQVWLNYQDHQVIGFTCRLGVLDNDPCTFPWDQIATLEAQRILVKTIPTPYQNVTTNLELERQIVVDTHITHEVWTSTGNFVGKISDCRIYPYSGMVMDYILTVRSLRRLTAQRFYLPPTSILSVGRGWMTVIDDFMQEIEPVSSELTLANFPTAELA
ncbi:PRC-barrel domain-containing protein [Acaryochloris marina]|uniref:PRC-barrel domain-containing protein n=1 Tax=Acaryochloris marina TaxID=155978 RepID=UPI001BB011C7|nr:PRC-barrel domain-containing protein [Acaryochloris marina]QUY45488.1 PRC-barrel domain-containing protein [Acaryochloris marina S15]